MPCHIKYLLAFFCGLFLIQTVNAQLCTGSLGDPVVNIDFGSGSAVTGPPLSTTSTNYTYITQDCPQDGAYTIRNRTNNCFSDTWHTLSEDHTPGDINGYMMIINASYNPGVFYLDTVKNLCGGTTYEFSAWVINMLRTGSCVNAGGGIKPNITFSIETVDGTVIQSINTGDIAANIYPQWTQYGIFFTLPSSYSNLVLRLTNNAAGGCGNDLALDDITFRPCGPKLNATFSNITVTNDTANYCISDNKTITLNGVIQTGFNNPSFQWQQSVDSGKTWTDIIGANSNSLTKTFSVAGRFLYRMSAAEAGNIGISRCRVASNVLYINIDAIPIPLASSTSPACVNAPLNFSAMNGDFYSWTGPNGFSSTQQTPSIASAQLTDAGKYYVLVTTIGGCRKTDSTVVTVNSPPVANAGADTSICESTTATLQASGGILYKWQPATGLSNINIANPVASPAITTTYTVTVGNQFFCYSTDSVLITVRAKPVANAGADKKIQEGETVQLNGSVAGDVTSFFWTPIQFISNNQVLTPLVNPLNDITYTLNAQSGNGCGVATDDVFVRVLKKIKVPNAFSPNGDGINDVWNIEALYTYPESETNVFNRYGQLVFHSQGYNKPWDGRYNGSVLPVGTYYYTIDRKNGFPIASGWLMIIR